MTKRPIQQKAFDVFNVIFMLVIGFAAFYPMWHVLCASFSDSNALMRHEGILLFPLEFSLNAYKKCLRYPLYIMFAPVLLCFLLFKYLPIYGLLMAFEDYVPKLGG